MPTEAFYEALPEQLVGIWRKLELDTLEMICKRVEKIGQLSETDIHQLNQLSRLGSDLKGFELGMAEALNKSESEVRRLFTQAAETEYSEAAELAAKVGRPLEPLATNKAIQNLIADAARATNGVLRNFIRTTGFFKRFGKG